MVEKGEVIANCVETIVARLCQKSVLRVMAGYAAMVVNTPHYASEVGNSLASRDGVDLAVMWYV
jgi:hypothetical protein